MSRRTGRVTLAVALAVAALAASSPGGGPTGNVNGAAEQTFIDTIQTCRNLENAALYAALSAPDQKAPLPAGNAQQVAANLSAARDLLQSVMDNFDPDDFGDGGNWPAEVTDASFNVRFAHDLDVDILALIGRPKHTAEQVAELLGRADQYKLTAQVAMQGVKVTKKDAAAVAANPDPPTLSVDPDVGGLRKIMIVTPSDVTAGVGDFLNALCRALAEPTLKYPYAKDPADLHAKTPKPPKNYYFAFTGKKPEAGYIFKSIGRPLFGPFEVKFQVGAFDPNATEDTGSACVEFDVQGSDPLQFLAVCGRRLNGGVQVFAQSHQGAAGNVFLAGARIAQVRVQYSGTQFICSAAAGKDAPDFVMTQFSTYNLAQGSTPLVAGIGGSGLVKGATIGLDEIYFTPK